MAGTIADVIISTLSGLCSNFKGIAFYFFYQFPL